MLKRKMGRLKKKMLTQKREYRKRKGGKKGWKNEERKITEVRRQN